MTAKNFYKRLLLVILLMIPLVVSADSNSSQNPSQGNGSAVLNTYDKSTRGLRIPARYYLELHYSNGMMSLESNYYEGEFDILLYNVDTGNSFAISSIFVGNPICMDLEFGNYLVTAKNIDGLNFSGYLEISF